jgi:hypothetical protein
LLQLAEDIETKDEETMQEDREKSDEDEDNPDGWVDEREELTAGEREDLEESVWPMHLVLTKVS